VRAISKLPGRGFLAHIAMKRNSRLNSPFLRSSVPGIYISAQLQGHENWPSGRFGLRHLVFLLDTAPSGRALTRRVLPYRFRRAFCKYRGYGRHC